MTEYRCRYCRQASEPAGAACPRCGAPRDANAPVSDDGWVQQPPIKDMARIQFGRSQLQIVGQQVPVADFTLAPDDGMYFSTRALLWADPVVRLNSMERDWSRVRGGLPLYIASAVGPGRVALSGDELGEMIALPLMPGQGMWVRERTFIAATPSITYTFALNNLYLTTTSSDPDGGSSTEYDYPVGKYGDVFSATGAPGLVLLHSPGDTFVRDLAAGEEILIQPGALLYKDLSVGMNLHRERPNTSALPPGFIRSISRYLLLRCWGPGRVALQSVFEGGDNGGIIHSDSPPTERNW